MLSYDEPHPLHPSPLSVNTDASLSLSSIPSPPLQVCPVLDQRSKTLKGEITDAVIEPGDCLPIPMEEGMVFELNNRVLHRVNNASPLDRVQLVVDVAESPRVPTDVKPGSHCQYVQANVVC